MEGSLSKVYFETGQNGGIATLGGGLHIEAVWGLEYPNHSENPTRAVIAALNIQRALKEFIALTQLDSDQTNTT